MFQGKAFFLCYVLVFLLAPLADAQTPDQSQADTISPANRVPWFYESSLLCPFDSELYLVDTTLAGFHRYDFFSPGNPFYASKGNVGHASRDLRFDAGLPEAFPLFSSGPYQNYRFRRSTLKFYRPVHVYTELYHVLGASREQLFYATHAQKLHETLTLGMQYRLIKSPGYYSNIGARNSNLYVTADFVEPGERYQALASVIVNRVDNQESGGLKNRQAFEEDPVRDSVFLYRAMSRYRETAIHLSQYYHLGVFSGTAGDSLADRKFTGFGRLHHHLTVQRQAFVFDEPAPPSDFYPVDPVFSAQTYDSTRVHMLENRLGWSNFPSDEQTKKQLLFLEASFSHRFVRIKQPDFSGVDTATVFSPDMENYLFRERNYHQFNPGVSIASDPTREFSFAGAASYTSGGYQDKDFSLSARLHAGQKERSFRLEVSAGLENREAPYFLSSYSGNYISWDKQFGKMSLLNAGLKLVHRSFSLEGGYHSLGRMVYLNEAGLPEQNPARFPVYTMKASVQLDPGIFSTKHQLVYQFVQDEGFERFPEFMSYHSLYASFSLFDKALLAHIGLDMTVHVPYSPMGYMPVVWQFYAQNDYESDHTFLLDVFANFQIKRTRFFVKMHHLMGLITDSPPVYSIPFYPLPEAAFKFGVSWMFFD
ncbi:MAG: putative porin [Bacteroidales bacterium]